MKSFITFALINYALWDMKEPYVVHIDADHNEVPAAALAVSFPPVTVSLMILAPMCKP